MEMLFRAIDDWNYKFIDQINLKRFLVKVCLLPNDALILAIIRRIDLDADAKLNVREFTDAIRPIENFTNRKQLSLGRAARPRSAAIMGKMSSQKARRRS